MEWCEIRRGAEKTLVGGIALVADAGAPYRIEYTIEIDAAGRTRRAVIRLHRRAKRNDRTRG
jgi:hypothetical protein